MAARSRTPASRQRAKPRSIPGQWRPLTPRRQAMFYEQLARMLKSGLPPSAAVASVLRTPWPLPLTTLARDLERALQGGSAMSEVFARYEPVVAPFDHAYLAASEEAGTVSEGLEVLAKRHWARHEQFLKAAGRLIYPLCLLALASVLGPLHLAFQGHVGLYLSTAGKPLLAMLVGLTGGAWLATTPAAGPWRGSLYRLGTRLPLVAPLLRRLALARLGLLLASCFRAGLPAAKVFALAAAAMPDPALAQACSSVERGIHDGLTLTEAVGRRPEAFPHEWVAVIETGEQAGRLDESLATASVVWREDADRSLDLLLRVAVGSLVAVALGVVALLILHLGLGIIGRVNEVIMQ